MHIYIFLMLFGISGTACAGSVMTTLVQTKEMCKKRESKPETKKEKSSSKKNAGKPKGEKHPDGYVELKDE